MYSKNKKTMTSAERLHVAKLKQQNCVVCDEPGPCDAHEPEQGLWFIAIPLCRECHTGKDGWHGTRLRWSLRKFTELKAINLTLERMISAS